MKERKLPWVVKSPRTTKKKASANIYNKRWWRRLSRTWRATNPFCVGYKIPEGDDHFALGTLTDHIIPIEKGGAEKDLRNLQTMCDVCHNRKRSDESRGKIEDWIMTEAGKIPRRNIKGVTSVW